MRGTRRAYANGASFYLTIYTNTSWICTKFQVVSFLSIQFQVWQQLATLYRRYWKEQCYKIHCSMVNRGNVLIFWNFVFGGDFFACCLSIINTFFKVKIKNNVLNNWKVFSQCISSNQFPSTKIYDFIFVLCTNDQKRFYTTITVVDVDVAVNKRQIRACMSQREREKICQ